MQSATGEAILTVILAHRNCHQTHVAKSECGSASLGRVGVRGAWDGAQFHTLELMAAAHTGCARHKPQTYTREILTSKRENLSSFAASHHRLVAPQTACARYRPTIAQVLSDETAHPSMHVQTSY